MSELFAGIDCSTQSCKLVIIDLTEKSVVYADQVNYDTDLPHYHTSNGVIQGLAQGVSESNPYMWIDALNMLFQRLRLSAVNPAAIKAMSVSGQQHGLVALDADGNLSRRTSKLWNDFSTGEECDLLTVAVGGKDAMIAEAGNTQRTGYTAAKIFHLIRHEPENYRRTATLFLVHNFVNWYLTGGVRAMEPGDASGMALWHPEKRAWSQALLAAMAPDLSAKLPPISPSDRFIGRISGALAGKFGFDPNCAIDAGCGDNMYGAVGTGNVEPGIVTISLGTSGTAYTFLEHAFIDPAGEIGAFCDSTGHYLPLLCVSNLANGYNAILQQFCLTHEQFNEVANLTPVGCRGRILVPWYSGERTPDIPLAAPIYFGFGLDEFTPEFLCRAVLEGHVLNLYDGFQRMPVQPGEIRLTGGLAKSDVWRQTIADVFNATVVPVEGEGAALGAALHAAWVYKKEAAPGLPLRQVVTPFIKLQEDQRKSPRPQFAGHYALLKKIYRGLTARARGLEFEGDLFALRNQLMRMQ
ncbi:MAG: xylulokinase [Candidatus Zhuqueibacterota bacterium]